MPNFVLQEASLVGDLLTPVKTEVLGSIGEALPLAGGVFAAIAGVYFGFKLFKKVTGARGS